MNVRENLSILFYLKRRKASKDGMIPIYIRITIDGLEEEISTGCKVFDADWDNESKTVRSTHVQHKLINKKISQARTDIDRHFTLVQVRDGLATPRAVKTAYLTPINGSELRSQRKEN